MTERTAGTFVCWRDSKPGAKPLGLVLTPLTDATGYVLMADFDGNTDLELFVARPEATGVDAAGLIREHFDLVPDPNPVLATYLLVQVAERENATDA